jgi:peptide/nickel transport system permease protein
MTTIDEQAAPIAIPIRPDETKVERHERLHLLVRSPTFLLGCILAGIWVICAIFGYLIAPHDPVAPDILSKFEPPSGEHLFGTDKLGQDVLSRVIVGARAVLVVAPLATIIGTVLGTTIGLVTGYYRGFVDEAVMRLVDAILAVPLIITALVAITALTSVGQSSSKIPLILVIGFVFTPIIAKTVRAAVLGEAQLEYVQAARLRNERGPYVMFAEILPNVTGPIIVEFTVRLGYAIFTVATLAFLGFAADPSVPDWGQDISAHYQSINAGYWWPVLFPSLAIATLIVGINLIADAIAQLFER